MAISNSGSLNKGKYLNKMSKPEKEKKTYFLSESGVKTSPSFDLKESSSEINRTPMR